MTAVSDKVRYIAPDGRLTIEGMKLFRQMISDYEFLIDWIASNAVYSAYAAMDMSAPAAGANIGLAWQTLTAFDRQPVTAKGIVLDVDAGTFSFSTVGVFIVNLNLNFEHNSSNGGRTFQARLYNVTDSTGGSGVTIGVGRNAEATSYSNNVMVEITEAQLSDVYRVEIGNGDSLSSVVWNDQAVQIHCVSSWADMPRG